MKNLACLTALVSALALVACGEKKKPVEPQKAEHSGSAEVKETPEQKVSAEIKPTAATEEKETEAKVEEVKHEEKKADDMKVDEAQSAEQAKA